MIDSGGIIQQGRQAYQILIPSSLPKLFFEEVPYLNY
jgi:hypothetical protein